MVKYKGRVASNLLNQKSFKGRPPQNRQEELEFTFNEADQVIRKIADKSFKIEHSDHDSHLVGSIVSASVEDNETNGKDLMVVFDVDEKTINGKNTIDIINSGAARGLSLGHRYSIEEGDFIVDPTEVSLVVDPARPGSYITCKASEKNGFNIDYYNTLHCSNLSITSFDGPIIPHNSTVMASNLNNQWSAPAYLPNGQQPNIPPNPNMANPGPMIPSQNQMAPQIQSPVAPNSNFAPNATGNPVDPNAQSQMTDSNPMNPIGGQQQQQQQQPFQYKAELFSLQNFQDLSQILQQKKIPTNEEKTRIGETIAQQEHYRRMIEDKLRDTEKQLKERENLVEVNKNLEQKIQSLNTSYDEFLKTMYQNGNDEDKATYRQIADAMTNFNVSSLNAGLQKTAVKASKAYTPESQNADNLLRMNQNQNAPAYYNPMNSLFNQQPAGSFGQSPFNSQPTYQTPNSMFGYNQSSNGLQPIRTSTVLASNKAVNASNIFGVDPNSSQYYGINSMINEHASSGRVNLEGFRSPYANFSNKTPFGIGFNSNSDKLPGQY